MSMSKALLVAFCVVATHAKPISPSKVARAAAEPSPFPLEGDACGNEWEYVNFDPEDETDKSHLQKLHDVICIGELRALSARGAFAASERKTSDNVAYDVFFDPDDEGTTIVNEILMKIAGQSSTEGMIGEIVGTMVIDKNDFGGTPDLTCDGGNTFAYTAVDEDGDGLEKIHVCDKSFDLPTGAPDIDCGTLNNYPSTKMDTFSRVMLHETLHYAEVGEDSDLGSQIVDQKNNDGEYAYGVDRSHGLIDSAQDDQPGKAESNADNYAFMSLDGWVGYNCAPEADKQDNWHKYFTENPPNYS